MSIKLYLTIKIMDLDNRKLGQKKSPHLAGFLYTLFVYDKS